MFFSGVCFYREYVFLGLMGLASRSMPAADPREFLEKIGFEDTIFA
jgi:hypothetical protein